MLLFFHMFLLMMVMCLILLAITRESFEPFPFGGLRIVFAQYFVSVLLVF